MTAQAFTKLGGREQIAALIDQGSCEFLHSTSPEELSLAQGTVDGVPVIAAAQHGEEQGGTLGAAHTGALLDLLEVVRTRRPKVLILLLDSGGVRLQEGNRGMAGLARVVTTILEVRRAGVVCIAIVGGRVGCWGGATLIAAACDKVLMVQNTRYGLSGPKVLQEMARAQGRALDLDGLWPYLSPEHRQFTHEVDLVATDEVMVVRNALAQLIQIGGVDPLAQAARALEQARERVAGVDLITQEIAEALPGNGPAPPAGEVLDQVFNTYTHRVPVSGVIAGLGELDGTRISFLGCTGEVAMGPAQGIALLDAALAAYESRPDRILLLADAVQAFDTQNEQHGYGQVLGGLLQALWYIHTHGCPVIGVVRHAGSGASMVALAMAGIALYAYSTAQIHPLPPNVVAAFGADADRSAVDASPAVQNFESLGVIREVWSADHAAQIRDALLPPAVATTG